MIEISYRGGDGCPLHAVQVGAGNPPLVLLHGGGPDHRSLLPLAERLAGAHTVLLPDVRGYGRSICRDPAAHTWSRYAADVISLLDERGLPSAALGGTGLGSTVTLRTALDHPGRITAAIAISVENIEEDDAGRAAETAFLDQFATTVRTDGLDAAWRPILPAFPPLIGNLIREAIPRADPASVAAAAAIGHDHAFTGLAELAALRTPLLVIPGTDPRHPTELAESVVRTAPHARLAPVALDAALRDAAGLAAAFAPAIAAFLAER